LAVELGDAEVAQAAELATGYSRRGLRYLLTRWQEQLLDPAQLKSLPGPQQQVAGFALRFLLANRDDDFVLSELALSLVPHLDELSDADYELLVDQLRSQLQTLLAPLVKTLAQ